VDEVIMWKLKKIEQPQSLAQSAREALREAVLAGHLKPGEVYNEMSLAEELGISRTPTREALLELSNRGLFTFLPRKGVMVTSYTTCQVEDLFEFRRVIELAVVEKVSRFRPPCDFSWLEKALKEQREIYQRKDRPIHLYLQFDRIFHVTLAELAGNQRFVDVLENIRDIFELVATKALNKQERWEEVLAEHEEIVRAVKGGDPIETKRAVEFHLHQSEEAVLGVR
jgi:GntR family transcriptional regulator, rspAB operon transcriptional repressor